MYSGLILTMLCAVLLINIIVTGMTEIRDTIERQQELDTWYNEIMERNDKYDK